MEWITVIFLVLLGISLIVVEVIFIPGTTVVGVIGLSATIFGIYLSYSYFGNVIGTLTLVSSGGVSIAALIYSLRSGAWDRFSLKKDMKGKVNENLTAKLVVGQKGVAISTLRPVGKAEFEGEEYEVSTLGTYIEAGSTLSIIKIDGNKVVVE